jgi:hexokinase
MEKFDLSQQQLLEIAHELEKRVIQGLEKDDEQEIKCLLTYVPLPKNAKMTGQALTLDLGGTYARAAHLSLSRGEAVVVKRTGPVRIPWMRKVPFKLENLLDIQGRLLLALEPPPDLPLGYCFSYATKSTPDGDAELIELGKEIIIEPNIVGKRVGELMIKHLKKRYRKALKIRKVSVINDAVASLFAALGESKPDEHIIGLIVGTGYNMATFMAPHAVPKLNKRNPTWDGPIPVNLEAGNFTPPHLTELDDIVDSKSDAPLRGKQRFEKAVAGVYLGHLLKAAFPGSDFDPRTGSQGLAEVAYKSPHFDGEEVRAARQILNRSAKLVASSLAGVIKLLNKSRVCIVAEGGLFWGAPGYKEQTELTLKSLLLDLGCDDTKVEFKAIEGANLKGSAVAALVGCNP